ncbi:hypothetical protein CPB83DRAFT_857727 [Crepidotus variabilis]|uniref:Uncharacterized protein n=1 Tax=Crepidotus variabilis TaxID=179855 RepID=A0A9P6ED06_9AGAR|nr:hypothetical protein CPB83DRAFT_857727 [Crepidotus variabilis]
MFSAEISQYISLTKPSTIFLLAFTYTHLLICVSESVRLHAHKFPPPLFIAEFGIIPSSAWQKCLHAHPFTGDHKRVERPSSSRCFNILRKLLSDPSLSEELVINQKRCAHVALKCLSMIASTTLDIDVVTTLMDSIPDDQVSYLWALWGLTSMLRHACRDRSLIKALKIFDSKFRWLKYYEQYVNEASRAINTYLNVSARHSVFFWY